MRVQRLLEMVDCSRTGVGTVGIVGWDALDACAVGLTAEIDLCKGAVSVLSLVDDAVRGVCGMGEVDMVEDLDKCNDEMSDVDTLERDGLLREFDLSEEEVDLVDNAEVDLLGVDEIAL